MRTAIVLEPAESVRDPRGRTLDLVADLTDEQLRGPLLPIVNPLIRESGHVAWFQEKRVPREETVAYLRAVRNRVPEALEAREPGEEDAYLVRVAVFHEDLHAAFVDAGGCVRREWWNGEGWAGCERARAQHPGLAARRVRLAPAAFRPVAAARRADHHAWLRQGASGNRTPGASFPSGSSACLTRRMAAIPASP